MAELTELQKQLFELQDIKYRDFHSKLMPETAKEKIIGIRTLCFGSLQSIRRYSGIRGLFAAASSPVL